MSANQAAQRVFEELACRAEEQGGASASVL